MTKTSRQIGFGNHHDIIDAVSTKLNDDMIKIYMERFVRSEDLMSEYDAFPHYLETVDETTMQLRNFNSREITHVILYPL